MYFADPAEKRCLYGFLWSLEIQYIDVVLHGIHKNFKVIIPVYGAWFTVLGTFRKDITQRFVFDDG